MPETYVNGINIYYEFHGPASAPILVLNNGVIMNASTSWMLQTPSLSRHFRLLQYDMRGQGQTDHPVSAYNLELHADDLAGLLENLKVDKAHVAGISYGGEVSQVFALKYPQKTLSLILADTVSEVHDELRIIVQSWIDALKSGDSMAFFNVTVPWNFSPQFIIDNQALMEDAKKRYAQLDFPAVMRLCESFLQVNTTSYLPEIQVPTCIIVGEKDLLKGSKYAEILQRGIPHSELHVIPGAGHATCWEKAEEFNTIVLGFLTKIKELSM